MIDEQTGYALASWTRFENNVENVLFKAITGAFVLVATADGDVADMEVHEYMGVLQKHRRYLPIFDPAQVERAFRDVAGAMLSDPEAGRLRALGYVSAVRESQVQRELVCAVAQIAVLADHRTLAREQQVVAQIYAALRLPGR